MKREKEVPIKDRSRCAIFATRRVGFLPMKSGLSAPFLVSSSKKLAAHMKAWVFYMQSLLNRQRNPPFAVC
jgi:hypothetical protein